MTSDPELTRIVRSWLEDGVTALPDHVVDSVMAQLPATQQRRRWLPAWRDLSMSTYARLAAAVAVVSILVIGGISVARPGLIGGQATLTPTSTASPATSPSTLLPIAPAAWCQYIDHINALTPTGPAFDALQAARLGQLDEWRRLGPEILALGRQTRSTLAELEGLGPVATQVAREAAAVDAWVAALEASFAPDAGVSDIDRIFATYDVWLTSRFGFMNAMQSNFETACP
ncbi:MAG TPA: hypothetical protein VGQ58_10595 [Candidatus Limnocylindrales bacterium]|nr:hypothetical protein [Candidatus Limnocylindrales bacterium]